MSSAPDKHHAPVNFKHTDSSSRIRLLPDAVASQVAAGEVVERPASVLKELMENSLDAKAQRIDVEFMQGGVGLIRVRDDGVGMNREDALLCLERHATSKIRSAEDLFHISTYGFRGEALPSIASVSRFRLVTRPHGVEAGTEVWVEGGKIISVNDSGDAPGTLVEVRNLFFNVPARRKFLRSETTETGHLIQCFQTFALAQPKIAFSLRKDNRLVHQVAPTTDIEVRIAELFGSEWHQALLPEAELESQGIRIYGMFSRLPAKFFGRSNQFFFLNRRPISDSVILRGIRAALPASVNDARMPACVLFLEMPPEQFDCNVHPTKREVRFRSPDLVASIVEQFVRYTLEKGNKKNTPTSSNALLSQQQNCILPEENNPQRREILSPTKPPPPAQLQPQFILQPPSQTPKKLSLDFSFSPSLPTQSPVPNPLVAYKGSQPQFPNFKFLSRLGDRYFLWQSDEGLVLMDAKNASERIYYDELANGKSNNQGIHFPSQYLLPPITFIPPARDAAWLSENIATLAEFGIRIEPFGPNSFKIEALPAGFEQFSPEEILNSILHQVRQGGKTAASRFLRDQLILTLAQMRARKVTLHEDDAYPLLRKLFECELPYLSPSGNPILLLQSWKELERKFH